MAVWKLFAIYQRYKDVVNSQLGARKSMSPNTVCDISKIQRCSQFTTNANFSIGNWELFAIYQRYKDVVNSQRPLR